MTLVIYSIILIFKDLYNIVNDLFQKYFTNLKLTKSIDIGHFKTITNFIIKNNLVNASKIYIQLTGIAQGGLT